MIYKLNFFDSELYGKYIYIYKLISESSVSLYKLLKRV